MLSKFFVLYLWILLLCAINNPVIYSQIKPEFEKNYISFIKNSNEYYSKFGKGKGTGYKQYMRMRQIMDLRVGTSETTKNFAALNVQEFQTLKRKYKSGKRSTHGAWEDLGPNDYYVSDAWSGGGVGRVNCIAFHPTDSNIFWVGTPAGGLWKTINGGTSWNCITNDFASIGITSIAVNYLDPDIIYILTGDGDAALTFAPIPTPSIGILKTTDGGLTWEKTGLNFGPEIIALGHILKIHPTIPSLLFVGLRDIADMPNATLLYSNNSGNSWLPVLNDITVWDIEFKPGSPATMYAATTLGMYKSETSGINFLPSNTGLPAGGSFARFAIAVSPSQPNNVYAVYGGGSPAGTFGGLFKSTDSGNTFTIQSNTPNILSSSMTGDQADNQATYDLDIEVDPLHDNIVYVGGVNLWKSINSGISWNRKTWWTRQNEPSIPYVHADFHAIKHKGTRLYACNDGGVYYTDDGDNWTEISRGLSIMQFSDIAVLGGSFMGGAQDNGTNESNMGNLQTHQIWGGDGFGCTWHNSDHSIQFLSSQNGLVRRQGFLPFYQIRQNSDNFWFTKLAMSNDNDHLFSIEGDVSLMRGHQDGSPGIWAWYNSGSGAMVDGFIKSYKQGVDNPNIMYIASERRLIKTSGIYTLPDVPWEILPSPDINLFFSGITIDPLNSNRIWVVCGGYSDGKKVYRSTDGGMYWDNISGSLPNIPVRCIILDPSGGDKLYIGTETGVFYRSSSMTDWIYFSNQLPNAMVMDLKISDGYIYAGTYGRGVWRSQIYSDCAEDLNLTVANDTYSLFSPGTQFHTAQDWITSSRIYNGSLGTNIQYTAGNYIELKDGFWAKNGSLLIARSGPCP